MLRGDESGTWRQCSTIVEYEEGREFECEVVRWRFLTLGTGLSLGPGAPCANIVVGPPKEAELCISGYFIGYETRMRKGHIEGGNGRTQGGFWV